MVQLLHPYTIWEDHKRWITEGNCFFTKSRINCISLEKRYLYLCTKLNERRYSTGYSWPWPRHSSLACSSSALHAILQVLLYSMQSLCTCSCLFHLKCSWWKCAHGSPAPFLGSWLKEHLYRRACSGHSTPNIIIHFLSPFLFYFSSSHCLLFSFIALRVYYLFVYFCLTALRRVVSQYCWINNFLNHQITSVSPLQVGGKATYC